MDVKYPEITVQLTGEDSNTFFVVSRTRTALKRGGVPTDEQEQFFSDALSGDADHALQTVMAWVNVE